jgi:wyosine [tRNA(Phe)-imidazoG37] synthetase (radical SAM superfamily)
MTVREIIKKIEDENNQLKTKYVNEIKVLKEENKKLKVINDQLTAELKNLMKKFLELKDMKTAMEEKPENVIVFEKEEQDKDSLFDSDYTPVVETPAKPKKSRKKKVEPVEEPIENA